MYRDKIYKYGKMGQERKGKKLLKDERVKEKVARKGKMLKENEER